MKGISMVLAVVLIMGVAALPVPAEEAEKGKKHDLTVEFVSADEDAMTLTIMDEEGVEKTVPMKKSALMGLEGVESGQMIKVTCLDDEDGNHQGIVNVDPVGE